MDNICSLNDNIDLSSMTAEGLEALLRSALTDVDSHLILIKRILSELRLRETIEDDSCSTGKAWRDFLEQSTVALYDLDS